MDDATAYTPGPWKVTISPPRGDHPGGRLYVETDQDAGNECSAIICDLSPYPLHELAEPDRHRADAQLIAAAPMLLAACESILVGRAIVRHESERPEWLEALMPQLRAAVAKAARIEGGRDGL